MTGTTIAKLEKTVQKGFESFNESFRVLKEENHKISEDLLQMKDQIIQSLMESNKHLQKRVQILEIQLQGQTKILAKKKNTTSKQTNNILSETTLKLVGYLMMSLMKI